MCPYDFLSGLRCAPAFFERCGRFTKNCVCSRLHSPQRLTRLCGCCDEPHFCFRKNGLHESLYHSQKKRTRPVRVCPYDFFVRGTVRFAKLRPLMRLPEVFCSLPTSRSEKVPFSAVSTNPIFAFAKTGFMNPCITAKKNGHDPLGCVRFWLRYRDSNPDRQSQRLQCYLYTISQYRACILSLYIILHLENLSRGINVKFQ